MAGRLSARFLLVFFASGIVGTCAFGQENGDSKDAERRAIVAIEALDGWAERDREIPGAPVTEVAFGPLATDDHLDVLTVFPRLKSVRLPTR